ncbi:hypothetical protein [Chryseobacterium hagamense]|uniref:Immunity protein 30 domain-containing protein n=1 Tax=Chryseobacterium hagamense TaxID=395935 RepID=A0A511YNT0_9FLAO|nr:hypothetical protein [Chryseobacterium hagamense]GEN76851.1 hypothetical protein CHA01nite_25910 [Chryseobacterium hagamense]
MKDEILQIKNYIDEIDVHGSSENFEYDFCPFLQNILDNYTAKQHDDFVKEIFNSEDQHLYFIARFLDFTDYDMKGKYESSYVFCECFSKINGVEYLKCLYINLELHLMQKKCFKEGLTLSLDDIVNNLYLLINHLRDKNSIDRCLEIIENLKN